MLPPELFLGENSFLCFFQFPALLFCIPWLMAPPSILKARSITSASFIRKRLIARRAHLGNPRSSPHIKIFQLITSAEMLFPSQMLQVLGIRTWITLGSIIQLTIHRKQGDTLIHIPVQFPKPSVIWLKATGLKY